MNEKSAKKPKKCTLRFAGVDRRSQLRNDKAIREVLTENKERLLDLPGCIMDAQELGRGAMVSDMNLVSALRIVT